MPAPAVIPAPKAYINAAAVKGFVVELWPVNPLSRPLEGASACGAVNIRNKKRGNGSSPIYACHACGKAPVIFTVTKKARPKQSFDLNFQAWDNKVDLRIFPFSAFVGFNSPWDIIDTCDSLLRGSGLPVHSVSE